MKQSYRHKVMTYKRLIRNLRVQSLKGDINNDKQTINNKKDNDNK
jgi:hypothetical protein